MISNGMTSNGGQDDIPLTVMNGNGTGNHTDLRNGNTNEACQQEETSTPSVNHDTDHHEAETPIREENVLKYQFGTFIYSDQEGTIDEREHKFVKVTNTEEKPLDVRDLVQKIKEQWKLKRPNLVISVTGGAWDFPMNSHVREVFRKGIVEAADSTDAVVITGGTNVGVMKYTGEAMKNYKTATGMGKKVVTLGIATWDKLRKDIKEELDKAIETKEEAKLEKACPKGLKDNGTLEPNHSHFILVDDRNDKWGADVPVRAELEKQIKTMHVRNLGVNVEIKDSQISCKCKDANACNRTNGRLNSASGWTPDPNVEDPSIEVNLEGTPKIVTEIVTQGNRKEDKWATKYKVQYEENGTWKSVQDESTEDKEKVFIGNKDRETEVKNILPKPLRASRIQLEPKEGAQGGISMRFELRGFEESNLEDTQIKCSSSGSDKKHTKCNHTKCRLDDKSAWTPDKSDRHQWLEIDLGKTKLVSKIVTKGDPAGKKWVKKYKIQYKVGEKDEWKYVKEKSSKNEMIFSGNVNTNDEKTVIIRPPIRASYIRIIPYAWSADGIGMQFELRGSEKLQVDNLGMKIEKIQDNQISCSSPGADKKHTICNHSRGRLNGGSSWSPEKQWIQVDLDGDKEVSEVVTQGNPIADQWVTKYKVQYKKKKDEKWEYAKAEGGEWIFPGNKDGNSKKINKFPTITASSVRLVANSWHNGISMRFDLKGPNGSVINATDINTTCSVDHSLHEDYCNHKGYRLNGESAWTPETQWIEVNLGTPKEVSEVVTKGNPIADHWVTKYKVQYKMHDGGRWQYVQDESGDMVFDGNSDKNTKESNQLNPPIRASVVRLVPVDWYNGISMRFDMKGGDCSLLENTADVKITCSGAGSDETHIYCNHQSYRLTEEKSAWTPEIQWIEVDLGITKLVSEVVTQGKPNADKWVTKYKVQYKAKVGDEDKWEYVKKTIKHESGEKEEEVIFTGNVDSTSPMSNLFPAPVRTSFIRLVPIDWINGISMRFELKGSDDLPVVCILVEGGPNSIQQACEAVEKRTPVVVVGNSGRASDVLAYAFQKGNQNTDKDLRNRLKKILTPNKIEESIKQINGAMETSSMLNVYDAKSSTEIDQMILLALMKANKTNIGLQMTLAQTWNRIDIVKDEIFESLGETLDWNRYQREEETNYANLHKALINDQAGFVKIYLYNMVVDLRMFLTADRLRQLYLETCQIWMEVGFGEDEMDTDILVKVGERLYDLTSLDFDDYQSSENDSSVLNKELRPLEDPWRHLFIFAILNDFVEMAEYFWEEGQEYIASALVASKIYKTRAEQAKSFNKEKKDRFLKIEMHYDELACEVLNECEEKSEDNDSPDILLRQLDNWGGKTCLNLAEISGNRSFIANSAVQTVLEDIWCHGKGFVDKKIIPSEFSRFALKRFVDVLTSPYRMVNEFYSPESKFWISVTFYLLFLALFTYVMVSDQLSKRWPEGWETLLIAWGITFIAEEIRQLLGWYFWKSIKLYFKCRWNWIDICMLGAFVIGFTLRFAGESESARIVLAFSVFTFYFRLLHKLTKFKHTGPKVLMIGHMMIDLIVFMGILLIVLIGYGVTVKAVLYPHVTDHFTVFREIIYRPYFQIYGELFLEDIHAAEEEDGCSTNETAVMLGAKPCPENSSWGIIFLAIYMIISNVLLLNLLIAMFSHTFDKVEEENDIHWKFLRYSLTKEYYNRPVLAPPLIILSHMSRISRFFAGFFVGWCMKAKKNVPLWVEWKAEVMVRTLSEDETARIVKMEQRYAYGNILSKRRKEREEKNLQTQMTEFECSFTSLQNQLTVLKGGFTSLEKKFQERK